MNGSDKELIETKTKELLDASSKMAERVYAKKGQASEPDACATGGHAEEKPQTPEEGEKVVDAEFTEVKDEKK